MEPIILCHAFEDKKVVSDVYDALQDAGFVAWLDPEAVFGEQEWEPDMASWLEQATFMLVFLSKNSVRKIDTPYHDFGQLIEAWKDMPKDAVDAICVRINDCETPDLLSALDHIDLFDDDGIDHVIRRLRQGGAKKKGAKKKRKSAKRGQASKASEAGDALDDFQVAVDGKGEVVDAPRSEPPMAADAEKPPEAKK